MSAEQRDFQSVMDGASRLVGTDGQQPLLFLANFGNMSHVGLAGRDLGSTAKSRTRSRRTAPLYVERESVLRACVLFEEDTRQKQLSSFLTSRRLAVVHGTADLGARQLAFATLRQLLSEHQVVELERISTWKELMSCSFQKGVGYTVELLGKGSGSASDRRRLGEKLKSVESFLIVRQHPGPPLEGDLLCEDWVVQPELILERLLRYLVGVGEEAGLVEPLLGDPRVQQVLSELKTYTTIEQLATGLADAISDAEKIDTVLERMRASGEQSLLEWLHKTESLDKTESLELRCHLIAASVLDGLPWSLVVDAARDLQRRLRPEKELQEDRRGFGSRSKEVVSRIEAELKPVQLMFGDAPLLVEGIRLRNSAWCFRAFAMAITHFVDAREALLAWLRELGLRDELLLGENLGRAAASLAKQDFLDALRSLLIPWADKDNATARTAVVEALDCFSQVSVESRALTIEVLRSWLHAPVGDVRAETAMSVLAQPWGWRNFNQTLVLLRERVRLVGAEHKELYNVVVVLARLVTHSDRPADALVETLGQCQRWTRGESSGGAENRRGFVGGLISLTLLMVIPPPALLDFMGERGELSSMVNLLMASAMRREEDDDIRNAVIDRVLVLVETAHGSSKREDVLRRFMAAFGIKDGGRHDDRERLASYLESRSHGRPFRALAEELVEQLLHSNVSINATSRGRHVRVESSPRPIQGQEARKR